LCNHYADKNKISLFIPLAEVTSLETSILDSIESMDIICIDDLDAIKGFPEWEIALFNLINNSLISGCRLVFGTSQNPASINFSLSDLDSRIRKINSTEVFPINDANLQEAVKKISQFRSIRLGDKELNYLITYTERSIDSLINILNKLDDLSIEQKRKITIPLIKEII
jgi:DnaA family protein